MCIHGYSWFRSGELRRETERKRERERERGGGGGGGGEVRILKQLIVKPTEIVDIKVWCNNRYGVLTCPNKLKAFNCPI